MTDTIPDPGLTRESLTLMLEGVQDFLETVTKWTGSHPDELAETIETVAKTLVALNADPEPPDPQAVCACRHTAHWHAAVIIDGVGRETVRQGEGECEASPDCPCHRFAPQEGRPPTPEPSHRILAKNLRAIGEAMESWLSEIDAAIDADTEPPRYTLAEVREGLLEKEAVEAAVKVRCSIWEPDADEHTVEGEALWDETEECLRAALDRFEQEEGQR